MNRYLQWYLLPEASVCWALYCFYILMVIPCVPSGNQFPLLIFSPSTELPSPPRHPHLSLANLPPSPFPRFAQVLSCWALTAYILDPQTWAPLPL